MPFIAQLVWGARSHTIELAGWVPEPEPVWLRIMIDPPSPPLGWEHYFWNGYQCYFSVPFGHVQPVTDWQSHSASSAAAYPYWFNLANHYSNVPGSIALQFLPAWADTSSHYHPTEPHSSIAEEFVPLLPDGQTWLIREGITPTCFRPLPLDLTERYELQRESVRYNCTHQLRRRGENMSVQLLRMYSTLPFPLRDRHIPRLLPTLVV